MHPTALRKQYEEASAGIKEKGNRIGQRLGIANPHEKVSPEHPARVRMDPGLAELYDQQSLDEFLGEVLEKLDALELSGEAPVTSLEEVNGITPQVADALRSSGYEQVEDLRQASVRDLVAVQYIGEAKARQIKEDVGDGEEEA